MITLNSTEARVLGSLMEKAIATPEYYPLSLNALMNACNQRSNRDPVMELDEDEVRQAISSLEAKSLAGRARGEGRVAKFEERTQELFNLTRGEAALLCILLLRGPQTPGELRGRTERLHTFVELEDVHSSLQRLMKRVPPLATMQAKQPGTKEARYIEVLSAANEPGTSASPVLGEDQSEIGDRLMRLEDEMRQAKQQIADLIAELATFRRQFE